jgi:hypothetical protein
MIDREHDLPITQQAEVLRISRGSVYYLPRRVPDADVAIMRRLDRLHLEFPFAGSRMLCICGPMTASARPALRLRSPGSDQIKPTSPRCQSAWQPNPGRRSTYRRGKSVQTTGPTSSG